MTVTDGWKDPQIFSPRPQPNSGGKGEYAVDPAQRLMRVTGRVAAGMLRRGENEIAIRVVERGVYRIGEDIQIEKVELAV